jgi:hypothetical protein
MFFKPALARKVGDHQVSQRFVLWGKSALFRNDDPGLNPLQPLPGIEMTPSIPPYPVFVVK